MTDMHREGFERWAKSIGMSVVKCANGPYAFDSTDDYWRVWQAAMRYRDEQEKQA